MSQRSGVMAEATVNGVRLVFQRRGEGVPVLMICGTGQQAATWELGGTLAAVLDAGCSVVTFDNRGIPPSECPPPPWTVGDMADDAIALIEHLGIGPCHVLGASLGALIAQTVALRRTELVRTVTLMVGGGNFSLAGRLALEGELALLEQGVEIPPAMAKANLLQAVLTPFQRQDDAVVAQMLELTTALSSSFGPGGQYGQLHADAEWARADHLAELADLSVPALVIAAEHDAYFPPAQLERAAETIPDARYVEIPGSAHVTTDPAAAQVALEALSAFLESH